MRQIQSLAQPYFVLAAIAAIATMPPLPASGEADLKTAIEAKTQEIKRLETEAEKYRTTLDEIGRAADTLQSQLETIDASINRLSASIRLTNARIGRTNLEVQALAESIREKGTAIERRRRELASLVGVLAASERETPLEALLKHETLSVFFASIDNIIGVQTRLQGTLTELRSAKAELTGEKAEAEAKKLELNALADELADQKALQVEERQERRTLLEITKNQERHYQELLAEVERKREALQQEINALEAGLTTEVDLTILPHTGAGVLGWPLERLSKQACGSIRGFSGLVNCVTQFFGRTSFARSGAYRGQGHNGVDLRAPSGTPVFASEQGRVRATGNTDAVCRRASYGQWILIDHPNNLSTLSAHLSLVKVKPGEVVNRGELIGYSGRTGYATGPHLHFTVFARQAVTVGQLKSRVCQRTMTIPYSPFGGYLNPLDYF